MRARIKVTCAIQKLGAGLFLLNCLLVGCDADSKDSSMVETSGPRSEVAIRRFCGDCHGFPQADTYPLDIWPEKVREGYRFYYSSLRNDLEVPPVDAVEDYYSENAPQTLVVEASQLQSKEPKEALFGLGEPINDLGPFKAVSHLKAVKTSVGPWKLSIADMRTGSVWLLPCNDTETTATQLPDCLNACHVEPIDLNQDGTSDFVVADLGSFLPEDHQMGAVWLMSRAREHENWNRLPLLDGIGRVADVQPLDADGDGDIDLIVAEFGWHATGKITLLRNNPAEDGSPNMSPETIDPRHGAIHVPVADLNRDGHPDFMALISQEHEVVEAFLNRGDGTFASQTVFKSDNPGFGSCGIQLCDLDSDGDLDVLFVNGDSLDTPTAKPYHSLCWFENAGTYPFTKHEICKIPGGYCVQAGDVDLDGDIDLALVTLLPEAVVSAYPVGTFDSVVWFEQTSDLSFVGHSIERDNCHHAACELLDWDGDGDLDLIVGDMAVDPTASHPLTLFRNCSR